MKLLLTEILITCGNMMIVQGPCNPKLESSLLEDLLSMMLKIKGSGSDKLNREESKRNRRIPAFAASLTKAKTLETGEIVKFDKVWTNILKGYDLNTGIFTAPREGVYQFSCTVMTPSNGTVRVFLWKNDMRTVAIYPGQSGYNMGTANMVLELKKNDTVYIKQARSEKNLYSDGDNFSTFSGYLIA